MDTNHPLRKESLTVFINPFYHKAFCKLTNVVIVDNMHDADVILNIPKMSWINKLVFRSYKEINGILSNKSSVYKLLSKTVTMPFTKDVTFTRKFDIESVFWSGEIKTPIFKPTRLSRGKGITFNKDELDVFTTYIVQEYIERPKLYNGRKFDIRIMISVVGDKYYIDDDALMRLSKLEYDADNKNEMLIHLTNVSQQKRSELQNDNLLLKSYNVDMYNELCVTIDMIMKRIKPLLRTAYCAMLGFDFIYDANDKLYLLEINTGPDVYIFPEEHYVRFLNTFINKIAEQKNILVLYNGKNPTADEETEVLIKKNGE